MRTVEVTDELQAYLDGLVPKRDQVLARMEEEAHRENIPIVDPHEGMLLYLLVKIAGAKRVLELGTATGYSGIWRIADDVRGRSQARGTCPGELLRRRPRQAGPGPRAGRGGRPGKGRSEV